MTARATSILKRYSQEDILAAAALVMESKITFSDVFTSPTAVKQYLQFRVGIEEREHFLVMFLNSQNALITCENMFSGSVSQTSVYPREIVRRALALNASSVILSHNHPSGVAEASRADQDITKRIKEAMALIDVRVLDHIIVSNKSTFSFAEAGLI